MNTTDANYTPEPKQRSEAQIAASRANGARSHGPTTDEGKAKCGQSNVRHALLANTILVTGESPDEFDRLLNSQIRELEPQTEGELMLVEEMVHCKWNQMRIWAMTAVGLSDEIEAQRETAPEMLERSLPSRAFRAVEEMHKNRAGLSVLHRYETAFSRKFYRVFKDMTALKEKRNGGTQA
jgi:hypothetical protein